MNNDGSLVGRAAVGRFPGAPYSFVVMNRNAAEATSLDDPHILISIHAPNAPRAEHPDAPMRVARLYCAFDDVGHDYLEYVEQEQAPPDEERAFFDDANAREIREFVAAHRGDVRWIAVHCEAGLSRSPGVAIALSRWLNGDDLVADAITRWVAVDRLDLEEGIVVWNRLVHDRLLAVLHEA